MLGVRGQRPRGLGAEFPAARGLRKEPKKPSDFCLFYRGELCTCAEGQRAEAKRFGG